MSKLPALRSSDHLPDRQLSRAAAARSKTELSVYHHFLEVHYLSACDQIDSEALSDVVRTALNEELTLLDEGMQKAAGHAAKAELVSRKVSMQSALNNRRIERRFDR